MAQPLAALALILLGAAGATAACCAPSCAPPAWASLPTADDLASVFPDKALKDERSGKAVLRCTMHQDGVIADCSIESEDPPEYGFGAAALRLSAKIRAVPPCLGAPETKPGGARLPIRFQIPAPPPQREAVFKTFRGEYARYAPLGPYWPEKALRMKIGGQVTIDCHVDGADRLSNCKTVEDEPAGLDFAAKVLAMAQRGVMTAGPAPANAPMPPDQIWRFKVTLPAHGLP